MIIAATRITSRSGHCALADHVWRGAGNSEVATLKGCEDDLADMVATARHAGRRYAIRHYQLSPGEPMNDTEALDLVGRIAAEFTFDAEAVIVIRHGKARRATYDPMLGTQGHDQHWHVLAPEVDPVTLRVLDSSWMHPRHERLAREAELRLLHRPVKGRFNTAVTAALERRGDHQAARLLREAGLEEGRPAYAAYTSRQRRVLERSRHDPRGEPLDLPGVVRRLAAAWAACGPDRAALDKALRAAGMRLRHPDRPPEAVAGGRPVAPPPPTRSGDWVIDGWDGRAQHAYVIGAAHTLLREPRARVAETLRPKAPRRLEQGGNGVEPSDDQRILPLAQRLGAAQQSGDFAGAALSIEVHAADVAGSAQFQVHPASHCGGDGVVAADGRRPMLRGSG
jgi:hypothetical protein